MGADKLTYTVSQLNNYVKTMIDSDPCLTYIYVVGEISNFTNHYKTGHFYLTLKDSSCAIKAVMFRSNAARIKFEPQNGMKVICRGRASLFERDGSFQFYIDEMQPDGAGALHVAFEQLCEKLKNEGLFDEAHKKPIPKFPERIAVITSPTGAAVQDMKNVISRRCPCVEVVMCPVLVQGDGAAAQLCEAVEKVNELNCADVIIIGRGGGSIEDLWAFNDETLARTIFNSKIPMISAVGHEIDFTVCDFVSDLRAPTPSAGAELAVPDINDVRFMLSRLEGGVLSAYGNRISNLRSRVKLSAESYVLKNPENYIFALREKLNLDSTKMKSSFSNRLSESREAFAALCAKLDAMSPLATIARGYSVTYVDKKPIKSVDEVNLNDCLNVKLVDGVINCTVNNVSKE